VLLGVIASWWAGVEAATRAGIQDGKRRIAIHLLLLPGTAVMMVASDFALASLGGLYDWFQQGGSPDELLWPVVPAFVVAVCIYALRLLAHWIASGSDSPAPVVP